jgi:hypothetical protein
MWLLRKDVRASVGIADSRITAAPRVPFPASRLGFLLFAAAVAGADIAIRSSWPGLHNSQCASYARITPGGLVFYFYCKWWTRRRIRDRTALSAEPSGGLRGENT